MSTLLWHVVVRLIVYRGMAVVRLDNQGHHGLQFSRLEIWRKVLVVYSYLRDGPACPAYSHLRALFMLCEVVPQCLRARRQ